MTRDDPDYREAARLAEQLPPKLLKKVLSATVELYERPGSGTLRVEKQQSARGRTYHMAVHGNEVTSDRYDEVGE